MSQQLVLAIDVGTSSAKVGLVASDGTILRIASSTYPIFSPHPGWAEQSAEQWWEAVVTAGREVMNGVDPTSVAAIGISTAGGSMTLLDQEGKEVRPAISWMDARAGRQAEQLLAQQGHDFWIRHTGSPFLQFWPVSKLVWLRENEPQSFAQVSSILQPSDYIILRLTGRKVTDRCTACATGFYDLQSGTWNEKIASLVGISTNMLPELNSSGNIIGTLTEQAAAIIRLTPRTPVVLGAWDQACAVVGAGALSGQDVLLSTGTAWVLTNVVSALHMDPLARGITVQHARRGQYLFMLAMSNGGSIVEWYRRVFAGASGGEEEADLAESDGLSGIPSDTEKVPPGSNGLLFLPHFIGAVGAHPDSDYSGCILGLRHGTGRAHVFRSILEAIAYEMRWGLEVLAEFSSLAPRLRMIGGATRSPIWPQIVADATGLEVVIPQQTECAMLGAAKLALEAIGIHEAESSTPIARCYQPDAQAHSIYNEYYALYRQIHPALKEPLRLLNQLCTTR
ncbi:MAG: xylulokinase [Anaerolineae bacterium]